MKPPVVAENAGIFRFRWDDEEIDARVDGVHQSQGTTHAEWRITSTFNGNANLIFHNKVNMLSSQMKKQTGLACKERYPEADWTQIIETICEAVLDRTREGEPARVLAEVTIPDSVGWRLHPLLTEGESTILFAYGGSLKSYLSCMCAVRIAAGHDAEPGNVLVLDWESNEVNWKRRLSMVSNGLGVTDPPNIWHRYCSQPLTQEIETIQGMGIDHQIDFYIIDSAAYACGGEPEKAEPTMNFFRAIRSLRKTTLVIAHQRDDDKSTRPFGSVYWANSPRSTIQIRKDEEHTASLDGVVEVEIALYNRKVNDGRPFKPIGYRVGFFQQVADAYTPGDWVRFKRSDIGSNPSLAKDLRVVDRIESLLKHGAMPPKDIAEELELEPGHIRKALSDWTAKGKFLRLDDGRYANPARTEEQEGIIAPTIPTTEEPSEDIWTTI